MSTVSIVCYVAVGILLLTVTAFVDRHTYFTRFYMDGFVADLNRPVPTPLCVWIVLVIAYSIPVFNVCIFILGAAIWGMSALSNEIAFGNSPKWLVNLVDFLTKPTKL